MTIRVLPNNLINQIAAGEVVERPSSVVKELVENAIDAQASAVTVEIKEGGISFIRITDNGQGFEKDDIPVAFLRHSTSKIQSVEDLMTVSSLGFRGEALPSIASVAKMKIQTRREGDEHGWEILIEGGVKSDIRPCAKNCGTRIEVRDLFYATPARLKFLKADSAETGACVDIVNRIARANPNVSFNLDAEGKRKLSLAAGNADLFDVRLRRAAEVSLSPSLAGESKIFT